MTGTPWLQQRCDERLGAFQVRHDLQLRADWTVIFGPSGTGKSTWLRMLAGLVPQRTGSLLLHGLELRTTPAWRRRIALVEQSPALFPHRNVEQNVSFGCHAVPECKDLVEGVLQDFRLVSLRRAAVQTLSGGERQRVAIARALASKPMLLLLDEVFTGMDAALRTELTGVLQSYCKRAGLPILSVTHDVAEAFATGGEVLRMYNGQIVAQGSPAEMLRQERAGLLAQLGREPS